ncbi:MAG: DUF3656 domain-containing protein [Tepidisphaeraceae bacterium]|jgi:putative protease
MPLDRPNSPELLAPAGDFDSLRAAVANGADAVYFGLGNYNARHRANNFTMDQLPEVMQFLHARNVRGFLALNTLIFSDELPEAIGFIQAAAAAGVDALIVQDLGLARLVHRMAPGMAIHGSTQMTLTEPRGIEFVRRLGVGRVILARELSLAEIARITAATDMPVEVFVHGALCVAYSGQCLTSEALGGRSANRGQCAQACRLPYELIVDGQPRDLGDRAYLLSPQDLAAYDLLDKLVAAGVAAFKIEGRLKSAEYVAAATQTYRATLDSAIARKPIQVSQLQKQILTQSFSRGFTHGFLDGVNHQELVHARFPKSRGVRIGTVCGHTPQGLVVKGNWQPTTGNWQLPVKPGDGLVFDEGHPEQDEQGGRVYEVLPRGKGQIELRFAAGAVQLVAVPEGAIVWKTDDPAIRKRLEQSYSRTDVVHRATVDATLFATVGQPLRLMLVDAQRRQAEVASDGPMSLAQRHPLTADSAREQLSRLGDTPYELRNVKIIGGNDPVMAPKSVLNDLRRRAVEKLIGQRARTIGIVEPDALGNLRQEIRTASGTAVLPHGRDATPRDAAAADCGAPAPALSVLVRTIAQLEMLCVFEHRPEIVYADFEDVRRYADAVQLARSAGLKLALATLRIVKPQEHGLLKQIADLGPDAVLVRNLAAVSFFGEMRLPMFGDYALNVANELTAGIFAQAGLERVTASYDLNWRQLEAMVRNHRPGFFEIVIHQHMPLFHMEHCVFAHALSDGKDARDCGRPCERHIVDLRGDDGQPHPLIADVGCRNTVFNAAAQSAAEFLPRMKELGLVHFRVELLRETPDEAKALLDRYSRVLAGQDDARSTWRKLMVLNQLGVTRGTLEHA